MLAAVEKLAPDYPPISPHVVIDALLQPFCAVLQLCSSVQFCTVNSKTFLQILHQSTSFLAKDPCHWDDDKDYQHALQYVVQTLAVVNDGVDRCSPHSGFQQEVNKGRTAGSVFVISFQ